MAEWTRVGLIGTQARRLVGCCLQQVSKRTVRGSTVPPLYSAENDAPLQSVAKSPFAKRKEKCLLCRYGIKVDFKNVRLLSQFLSSFSGRLYEKHITGLCEQQQRAISRAIASARKALLMPVITKEPRYLKDPRLFDPMNPRRANPY